MADSLPEQTASQIRNALAEGNKIEAVRLYRDFAQVGLAEAKSFIEQLERGDHLPASAPAGDPSDQTQSALFAGNKILAIKLHREATACSLRDAKLHIDALEKHLRETQPHRFSKAATSGCLGIILLGTTAGIALARLLA